MLSADELGNLTLVTERLVLSPISEKYAKYMYLYFTSEVTRYMYPSPFKTADESNDYVKYTVSQRQMLRENVFAVTLKNSGEFIGCIGIHHIDTRIPEIGLWTKVPSHGNHYGAEGVGAVIEWARSHLKYDYIYYPVGCANVPSRKLVERLGGELFGKKKVKKRSGEVLDIVEYKLK